MRDGLLGLLLVLVVEELKLDSTLNDYGECFPGILDNALDKCLKSIDSLLC